MTKTFIDKLWESKDNLKLIEDKEFTLNWEKVNEYQSDINNLNDYVPILLKFLLDYKYISSQSEEVVDQFSKAYWIHRVASSDVVHEFLRKDLLAWLEEHPQFKDIIIETD